MAMLRITTGIFVVLVYSVCSFAHASDLYFIDAHSQVDENMTIDRVIQSMDEAGVKRSILAARGRKTNREILDWAAQHPQRIIASIRTKGGAYMNNRPRYYEKIKRQAEGGRFAAMAELLLYHAAKGDFAPEVIVQPDDERVTAALNAIRDQAWPLVLHIEFAALSSSRKKNYWEKLETLLRQHPQQPFALIHMGQLASEEVKTFINNHPNIYFLTSHSNTIAVNRSKQPWVNMFDGEALAPNWRDLVITHPDRFIFAVDNVFKVHWRKGYTQQLILWRKALSRLPDEVAHAVAHGNAERLWALE
ncbi:MAG: amidohydrolase [Gammaproteobacteria bacterium]|nr:amidohydrolase [Gammaproteobacteria bacterium]